jgi:4-diphosphocytidyl-2-C-methyl-D-erythritol kinase
LSIEGGSHGVSPVPEGQGVGLLERLGVQAPAKINLTLEILGRRDDGYHALRSVMVPIALADELAFQPSDRFAFACDPPSLAGDNLVVRAFARIGLENVPLAVALRKRIPVGAGLGGGSSDAAAVLRAAMRGELGSRPERDWIADARALGSDIPFFLVDGPAIVEGTGERVTALGPAPPWWIVLVVPNVHVATGPAYARLAETRRAAPLRTRPRSDSATLRCGEALQRRDYDGVLAALTNDFEPIVRDAYPEVDATLSALAAAGAPGRAMLSGSGGSCFALFPGEDEARRFAGALRAPRDAAVHLVPFAASDAWVSASA